MTVSVNHAVVDFEAIVRILNKHRVEYVVIGGMAAIVQGVPLPRTFDVDITPASDRKNYTRLAGALIEMEAKLRAPGLDEGIEIPLDHRTFQHMTMMTFVTMFGPLDVAITPDGTTGYEDLKTEAVVVTRSDLQIPVSSIQDIIRSKRAAGREKDADHLTILEKHTATRRDM